MLYRNSDDIELVALGSIELFIIKLHSALVLGFF